VKILTEITIDQEKKEINRQIEILTFDCYEFYKFIEALDKYTDELELVFENRDLTSNFMDASRMMMSKCTKHLDNSHGSELLEKMVFGINTSDFSKILKTRKSDKKQVELTFDNTKTYIELVKTSGKYNSHINKTLNLLDLELEEIPMDNLLKIDYNSKVEFPIEFLDDFFYESSNYSEIIEIEINDNIGLSFSETGTIGNSKYLIKNKYCSYIDGNQKGSYSYTFITPIKPLLPILVNSDIKLNIKTDHPIKLELYLSSLDINFLVFLAPRVEEAEFDEDDDDYVEYSSSYNVPSGGL